MSAHRGICVIATSFCDDAAVRRVRALVNTRNVQLEQAVYYPYHRFVLDGSVASWFGRRRLSAECLVDAQHGVASTSDPLTLVERFVDSAEMLPEITNAIEARNAALRYGQHAFSRLARAIASVDVNVQPLGTVFRRFSIVRAGPDRVMVDSVTGGLHPLRC